jgi:hypothetical protein
MEWTATEPSVASRVYFTSMPCTPLVFLYETNEWDATHLFDGTSEAKNIIWELSQLWKELQWDHHIVFA